MTKLHDGNPIGAEMRREIALRLAEIERERDVHILFAVESGSRAWGFPSPDSDYDVRFVYVHRLDWYLSIERHRDVIEEPLVGELDLAGWELRKALNLLLKPSQVMLEWLRSPIVYRADAAAMARLGELAARTAFRLPSTYHYLHLAESQYRRYINGRSEVPLKKYFYVVRPVLALMWLRLQPGRPVPMALPELRAGIDLPRELSAFLDDLLARKAVAKELGSAPRLPALDSLIEAEIEAARAGHADPAPKPAELLNEANALFRTLVRNEGVMPCC